MPLGLFHDDHPATADAALDVIGRLPSVTWLGYADAIYRRVPGLLESRLEALGAAG